MSGNIHFPHNMLFFFCLPFGILSITTSMPFVHMTLVISHFLFSIVCKLLSAGVQSNQQITIAKHLLWVFIFFPFFLS